MKSEIRVLVIDDSRIAREMISHGLNKDPGIVVVATAEDPYEARDLIITKKPDVLTLDVDMPRMNGIEFLKKFMPQYPLPVIMVSAYTQRGASITMEALDSGAVDFVPKPKTADPGGFDTMIKELTSKIKMAETVNVSHWKKINEVNGIYSSIQVSSYSKDNCIIAAGASTGGTEAIKKLIKRFPIEIPGIVIVLHMPGGFTKSYAERLNEQFKLTVKEAEDGDVIGPGKVFIAPGGFQMEIRKKNDQYVIKIFKDDPVNGHCPSVDVLFESVASVAKNDSIGIILTGMGSDGANGLLQMKKNGARTYAQDEESSLIYGMPRVAYEIGAVDKVLNLDKLPQEIFKILNQNE